MMCSDGAHGKAKFMAVVPYLQSYLMALVKKYAMRGDLLTYGRQDVFTVDGFIERCARASAGLNLSDVPAELAQSLERANPTHLTQYPTPYPLSQINDQIYFRKLGFQSVTSLDAARRLKAVRMSST